MVSITLFAACIAVCIGSWGEDVSTIFWRRHTSAYSVMLFDSATSTIVFGIVTACLHFGLRQKRGLFRTTMAWYLFGGLLEGASWFAQLYTVNDTAEAMQAILRNTSVLWSVLLTQAHKLHYRGHERKYSNRFVIMSLSLVFIATIILTLPFWQLSTLNPSFCLLLVTPVLSAWSHVIQQRGLSDEDKQRKLWIARREPIIIDPTAEVPVIAEGWHLAADLILALFVRNATQLLLTVLGFGFNYLPMTRDDMIVTAQRYFSGVGVDYSMIFVVASITASVGSVVIDNTSANYHEFAQTFSSPFVVLVLYLLQETALWVWATIVSAILILLAAVMMWRHWELHQEEVEKGYLTE